MSQCRTVKRCYFFVSTVIGKYLKSNVDKFLKESPLFFEYDKFERNIEGIIV